ncbi:hypothetical protein [Paraburkholderia hayleyella]|uniref:hypothetical protein n=1 Tax=Paraburkholderia hayleyella TaxID=2152889 RepID=UPI001292343F|nr:hypothetical protein [Paraburkholderia hayleyella]
MTTIKRLRSSSNNNPATNGQTKKYKQENTTDTSLSVRAQNLPKLPLEIEDLIFTYFIDPHDIGQARSQIDTLRQVDHDLGGTPGKHSFIPNDAKIHRLIRNHTKLKTTLLDFILKRQINRAISRWNANLATDDKQVFPLLPAPAAMRPLFVDEDLTVLKDSIINFGGIYLNFFNFSQSHLVEIFNFIKDNITCFDGRSIFIRYSMARDDYCHIQTLNSLFRLFHENSIKFNSLKINAHHRINFTGETFNILDMPPPTFLTMSDTVNFSADNLAYLKKNDMIKIIMEDDYLARADSIINYCTSGAPIIEMTITSSLLGKLFATRNFLLNDPAYQQLSADEALKLISPSLKKLILSGINFKDSNNFFSSLKNTSWITLDSCQLQLYNFHSLKFNTHIHRLDLYNDLIVAGIMGIISKTNITTLSLCNIQPDSAAYQASYNQENSRPAFIWAKEASLPKLQQLNLLDIEVNQELSAWIKTNKNLTELTIKYSKYNQKNSIYPFEIAQDTSLSRLSINCAALSYFNITCLARAFIKNLSLTECKLTNSLLALLAKNPTLITLDASGNPALDSGIFKSFDNSRSPIKFLDVSETKITLKDVEYWQQQRKALGLPPVYVKVSPEGP